MYQEESLKRVLTFGTFDHLHPGHIAYLTEAASYGDLFIVVATDHHVRDIKGKAPEQSEEDRLTALKKAFPDADVRLGDHDDYLMPVQQIQPDLIVMGYDQKLPPGVSEHDLPCSIHRATPFEPEKHKSSFLRQNGK